jgi:hypothetical protein
MLVLVIAGGASAFVISRASSKVVQRQPPPGSCHVRGRYPFNMPDLHCTPGALNPAVTQATIKNTICRSGYTSRIRPSTSVTGREKLASIRAYGLHQGAGAYEYDHLIPLELGGAANDSRNLWPENGGAPNPKDKVENYLRTRVCDGRMLLARAQLIIALDWVSFYNQIKPKPSKGTTTTTQPTETHPSGATGQCADGTYTYATHHQGACSHHGGVVEWF